MRNYRNELKFITYPAQAEILKQRLALLMDIDDHSVHEDNTYSIRSLYFDDDQSTFYHEKLNGVLYRKKYRLRVYNNDDRFIRLECKMKHNNMTAKEQCKIDRQICDKILSNDLNSIETGGDKLLNNFIIEMKSKHLTPSIIVEYKRTAFTYPVSRTRITFDQDIKSGMYNYGLFDEYIPAYQIFDNTKTVIEVKFDNILPLHIARVLETIPMFRQAVSKYAICRNIK
jgi:SPX domain protein involved in polyphosphate accumulation